MDQHLLQGWHADPYRLHEQRYFSAGQPTKLVRDGRVEAYDEPPAQDAPAAGVAAATSASPAANVAAVAGLRESTTPGVYQGQPSSPPRDATSSSSPAMPDRAVPARTHRTGLVYTLIALTAAAAVVAFVAVEGGFSPAHQPKSHAGSGGSGTDLAAFVTRSARATLAEKTADVSLTATSEIDGSQVTLRGNGQLDLAANTFAFNLTASGSGSTFAESEIMTSQALYVQVTVDGHSMAQYLGGKHWLELPIASSASLDSAPQASPAGSLQLLEEQGARVVPLGSRTIGGLTCSGYSVTPSQQAMLAAAQREWSELGVPASERAAAEKTLEDSPPPAIAVWLDPSRDLACELDVQMQMGTGTSAGSGSALGTESTQLVLTFAHYGVPVNVTPPAASDTFSLQSNSTTTS